MVELELDTSAVEAIEKALERLKEDRVRRIYKDASKRAITTARKAGIKALGHIYVFKGVSVLKSSIPINKLNDGAEMRIKGGYTSAQKYFKIKSLKRKGVFVSIKKGIETNVPNGFVSTSGIFMKRQGKDRYPLKGIYGPALPQMFGNETVMNAMQKEGMEMYEKRLYHELERALGGN